jgi:ubiquinone/menaquinone biosynthesis C-methylase UbiE
MLRQALSHPVVFAVTQAALGARNAMDAIFRDWISVGPGTRVLDVGCGIGSLCRHLETGVSYVGADLEWGYLRHAADRYGPKTVFVQCDVTRPWPFRENGFDYVFGVGLLHHLSDAEALFVLGEARRMLKPSGVFYTVDPFARNGQHWITRALLALDRGAHIRRSSEYHRLVESVFARVSHTTSHDLLRVPYDLLMMRCHP